MLPIHFLGIASDEMPIDGSPARPTSLRPPRAPRPLTSGCDGRSFRCVAAKTDRLPMWPPASALARQMLGGQAWQLIALAGALGVAACATTQPPEPSGFTGPSQGM